MICFNACFEKWKKNRAYSDWSEDHLNESIHWRSRTNKSGRHKESVCTGKVLSADGLAHGHAMHLIPYERFEKKKGKNKNEQMNVSRGFETPTWRTYYRKGWS